MFRKADSSVYENFLNIIDNVFPELSGLSFGLLYREKIKKSRGGLILAEVCKPNKLMSYFAKNDSGNPFDFLIIVDEMAWCCAKDADRVRIMRHELRHVHISEKGKTTLRGHDFQDFYAEVDLNADDPSWGQKLVEVTLAGYNQVKDGQADPRLDRRDAEDIVPVTKDPQVQTKIESAMKTEPVRAVHCSDEWKAEDDGGGVRDNSNHDYVTKVAKAAIKRLEEDAEGDSVVDNLDALARKRGLLPPVVEDVAATKISCPPSSLS
jgi:hypothetical protein